MSEMRQKCHELSVWREWIWLQSKGVSIEMDFMDIGPSHVNETKGNRIGKIIMESDGSRVMLRLTAEESKSILKKSFSWPEIEC